MIHDQNEDEPALARLADDGNPNGTPLAVEHMDDVEPEPDTPEPNSGPPPDNDILSRLALAGPFGGTRLVELIDALLTIGCHAVAHLHPADTRDIPAEALEVAASRLPLFYPDRNRAGEVAQVWAERAAEVRRWRARRLAQPEPEAAPTPFPTAVAGAYSQKIHGSPGVFATHDIGVDADGQPVLKPKAPVEAFTGGISQPVGGPKLSPAAERKLQKNLARLREMMATSFGTDAVGVAGLAAYMRSVEAGARGVVAVTGAAKPRRGAAAVAAVPKRGKAKGRAIAPRKGVKRR